MAKKILIVDDEPHIVRMLESRLMSLHYDVSAAYDGQQCIDMIKENVPDLVILDLKLPKLDGYQVLSILRADKLYKDLPIIMLTASGQAKNIETGLTKGADAYLVKPFKATVLLGIVKGLLGK